MAAVASESEQVVDQANENILAEEKAVDDNLTEEKPKEGGKLSQWRGFVASRDLQQFSGRVWESVHVTRGLYSNTFPFSDRPKFHQDLLVSM